MSVGVWHCSRSQYSQLNLSPLQMKHHGRVSLSGFLQSQEGALLEYGEPPEGPKGKLVTLPGPFSQTGRMRGGPGPSLALAPQSCSGRWPPRPTADMARPTEWF